MARVKIVRPDGSPSPFFWKRGKDDGNAFKTVYKVKSGVVKRLRGVRYDPATNTFQKD